MNGKEEKQILIRVPDFVIVKGGRVRGIELGRERIYFGTQKGVLISSFSGASGISTTQVNILIGNPIIDQWYDFGFKCNRCYRSFTLCKAFIDGEIGNRQSFHSLSDGQLNCKEICGTEAENCKDGVVHTKIRNYNTNQGNLKVVHYKCLLAGEINDETICVPFFPRVEGIDILREGLL